MTTLSRWTLVALLATGGAGCGGSTLHGGTGGSGFGGSGFGGAFTGTGGTYTPGTGGTYTGTGGFIGDGGSGWGGSYGAGGFFPTGGTFGGGGNWGTGGQVGGPIFPDAGACSTQDVGPTDTSSPPRPFGWTFSGPTGTDGGAPATAGSADGGTGSGPARCLSVPAAYPGTSCVGSASLQASATGPRIVFADGSRLDWNDALPSTMKPYVTNATAGDTVWVDYEKRNIVVCAFCGAYTTQTLQVRDGQGQRIRFFAQQGAVLPALTDAQVTELFGVAAAPVQTCTFPAYAGCSTYLRIQFDHQLATTPRQLIVDATLTTVTAPNGRFAVIWASSEEGYIQQQPNCFDGAGVATDNGFVATLLSP